MARTFFQVTVDVRDDSNVWKRQVDGCSSAATTTAGGLLLIGRGPSVAAYDSSNGEEIYNDICLTCHGEDGEGGHSVGGAIPKDASLELIFAAANNGVAEKMPAFKDTLTAMELKSVATYIKVTILSKKQKN